MDKNKNAVEQLKEGISVYVDKKLDNIPFDRTFTALITKVSSNNTYSVLLNGVEYNNIRTIGGSCYINETVKVVVPQNNYNNMYILKVFEDTSSYKLYEYSNDYEFAVGGNPVIKQWNWKSKTNKDCYFRITDEYFVTKEELYRQNNSNNLKAKGNFIIVNTDETSVECNFDSAEITYRDTYTNQRIACIVMYDENTDSVVLSEANRTAYNQLGIKGKRTTGENFTDYLFMSSAEGSYWYASSYPLIPVYGVSYPVKLYYFTPATTTDYSNCYISANFPIFESVDDAFAYKYAESDSEALTILERAINYKGEDSDELFSTTILMNPNSKIKIDMEFLLNYDIDEIEIDDEDNFTLQYYIDGELDTRQPKGMLNKGNNVVRVMYVLSNDTGGKKSFSVGLKLKRGNVTVQERGVWVTISGIGLLDQTFWNGDISIEEAYELIMPLNPIIVSFDEDVDVTIIDRPIIRNVNWGYMLSYTWKQAGDNYIW